MDTRPSVDDAALRLTPLHQAASIDGSSLQPEQGTPASPTWTDDDRPRRYDPFANSIGHARPQDMIDAAASTDATVLISGEHGVGKELLARVIHQAFPGPANRLEELPLLVDFLLDRYARLYLRFRAISPGPMRLFHAYSWNRRPCGESSESAR